MEVSRTYINQKVKRNGSTPYSLNMNIIETPKPNTIQICVSGRKIKKAQLTSSWPETTVQFT